MEKKKTNNRQFAWLVSFMEKYPELAKGGKFTDSRESISTLWATVQTSLNSLGPPTRSVVQWQKVWNDKKLTLKRKLQHNNNEVRATGGGQNTQHSFTDLEEAIIRLLSLDRLVTHTGTVFGTQPSTSAIANGEQSRPSRPKPCNGDLEDEHESDTNDPSNQSLENQATVETAREDGPGRNQTTPRVTPRTTPSRGSVNKRNYRKALLEKQTDDLSKIKEYVSDCARYSRKSFAIHQQRCAMDEKRLKLEEDKFRFEKQMRLEEHKQRREQLQMKLKALDYKRQKLDFETGRITTAPNEDNADENYDQEKDPNNNWDE